MFPFLTLDHFWTFTLFIFFLKSISADSNPAFSFSGFVKNPKLESTITLYGDSKILKGENAVQLTNPVSSSAGRIMYKKPIIFLQGNPKKLVSFSTNFSFSLSPNNGDGVTFVLVPSGFSGNVLDNGTFGLFKAVVVEFKNFRDENENLIKNLVEIGVGISVSSDLRNVSKISKLTVDNGQKLQAWINYEVGSRRLEVRMARNGDLRPYKPFLSYPIDFSHIWGDEEVFVGLSSSNGNLNSNPKSSQTCLVFSWSFKLKNIPNWMHSQPLDPKALPEKTKHLVISREGNDCVLRVLAAMIFGTGCGALAAFIVLYLWAMFGNRRPVVPEEFAMQPVDMKYEKVEVVVDKDIEDGKKVHV